MSHLLTHKNICINCINTPTKANLYVEINSVCKYTQTQIHMRAGAHADFHAHKYTFQKCQQTHSRLHLFTIWYCLIGSRRREKKNKNCSMNRQKTMCVSVSGPETATQETTQGTLKRPSLQKIFYHFCSHVGEIKTDTHCALTQTFTLPQEQRDAGG